MATSSPSTASFSFGKAKGIRASERDRSLGLDDATWPTEQHCPPGWTWRDGRICREIKPPVESEGTVGASAPSGAEAVVLDETILRFPSAPIHGLHRLHEHHVHLGESENFHSYRVLRSADPAIQDRPVKRIFLLHAGLNECDSMGWYYRLASNLIKTEGTACIVRPFPGHLARFPFQGFAETPLDRYLWDGSHLFRQFLRFMIETQWFLSALARRGSYRYASGANLLAENDDLDQSRLNPEVLAAEMSSAWLGLHKRAKSAVAETLKDQPRAPQVKDPPESGLFEAAITSLRDLLKLESHPVTNATSADGPAGDPAVHVIGYSLGGFTAQSVFMSWPFMVMSCCTLLAGGALRELAPSEFAHPEEWQTVLHSLRYELDDRLMSEEIGVESNSVAGIDTELFVFFKRTFYEVFQQEYRGSIQTRLAAFRQRMLFVVGGNDPVVRPKTVLDSGPPGGINLLEIGGLGHFLDAHAGDREEERQRSFWWPEMASLLSRFADRATKDQALERRVTTFDAEMERPSVSIAEFNRALARSDETASLTDGVARLAGAELLAIGRDGALPGASFERCLDDLLARAAAPPGSNDEGVLFMLRNDIPTLLLHDALIRERAAALYHDDVGIVRYCHGVAMRRQFVRDHIGQICLVLPWNARRIMATIDLHPGYPSQAESAGGQAKRIDREPAWEACLKECRRLTQGEGTGSVRMFDGNPLLASDDGRIPAKLRSAADRLAGGELTRVASLPDCWLWVSRSFLNPPRPADLTIESAIEGLCSVVPHYCRDKKVKNADRDNGADAGKSADEHLLEALHKDEIRIIEVSRARYNPRYRGRLVVNPKSARKLMVHAALCLTLSQSVASTNLDRLFE
jgi:hypothetical protein